MGQRPERCAVGQTWLSLLAPLRVHIPSVPPFKPLSVVDHESGTGASSLRVRDHVVSPPRAAVRVWLEEVMFLQRYRVFELDRPRLD